MPIGQQGSNSRLNFQPAANNVGVSSFPFTMSVTNVTPGTSGLSKVVAVSAEVGLPSHFNYSVSFPATASWQQLRFGGTPDSNDYLTTAQFFEAGFSDRTLSGNPGSKSVQVPMPAKTPPYLQIRAGSVSGTRTASLSITGAQLDYQEYIPDLTDGGWTLLSDLVPSIPRTMRFTAPRDDQGRPLATYSNELYRIPRDVMFQLYDMQTTVSADGSFPRNGTAIRLRVLDYRLATIFILPQLPSLSVGFSGQSNICGLPLGDLADYYGKASYGALYRADIPIFDDGLFGGYMTNLDWVDVQVEVYTDFGRVTPAFWTGFANSYEIL